MVALTFALVVGLLFAVPPRFLGTNMIPELIAIGLLVLAFQLYAKRLAAARLSLARDPFKRNQHEEVLPLLEPFLGRAGIWPNARFDVNGEALYMLAKSYLALGKHAEARQVQRYGLKYRRGEFAEKLAQLKIPSPPSQ